MNVSHKHKVIWWAPERTASKLISQIFKHYEFVYYENKKKTNPLGEPYHSHILEIPEGCEDYRLICSIRNPYDRILSLFLNFTSVGRTLVYTRDKKPDFIKRFDYFTKELFIYAIKERKIVNNEREVPVRDYVSRVNFTTTIPSYFIRMENLVEDLNGLDFISESELWKSGFFNDLIENNKFINRRPYTFDQIYTFEGANRVYQYQKKLFFICGYDPFSFTTENLSNDDKKKFLHETF